MYKFLFLTTRSSDGEQPDKLPIVVTLVTERGRGDNTLLTGVQKQLDSLSQHLTVKVTVIGLNRFGMNTALTVHQIGVHACTLIWWV